VVGNAVLLLGLCLQPQDPAPMFQVQKQTDPPRAVVAADKKAITCMQALQELGAAMNWNVHCESMPLQADLTAATVDLYFAGQDPRVIGQLIAVAGGADTVFDEGDPSVPRRPTLHVVRLPDPSTEAGRLRMRGLAAQWYRSFLLDELRHEPLVRDEAMQVRMHLGHLLRDSGDLESAITYFAQVYENRPHNYVPAAVLRIAEISLDLGHATEAENWARRLLEAHPSRPEATAAVVLLGRSLLAQGRFDECRTELGARLLRLSDSVAMLDVYLLVGEAEFRLEWPTRVFETVRTLRESPNFGDMEERQFLDYHFLLGYGALGSGKQELAMKALEWFLIQGTSDRRRGIAYVLLAQAYLEQNRLLEARAAAVEARERQMPNLHGKWRRQALKLYARSALALGDKEAAFREMEVLVHRESDPELTLFLVDQLLQDRQWQWAVAVGQLVATRQDVHGDEARFRIVQALFEQGRAAKNLEGFPSQAAELALKIKDSALRSRCATLIGDAYASLGKPEHAADAYRGILR
jgi:tetratricopeptide (TPR) repeat protein